MRDSRSLTDEVEYFDPLTEDQKAAARKTVCGLASDADDAAMLLHMLGIHPADPEEDLVPNHNLTSIRPVGLA